MTVSGFGGLGVRAVALSLLFSLIPTIGVGAQEASSNVFVGVIDEATDGVARRISFERPRGELPAYLTFMLLEYEDDVQAEEAFARFAESMSSVGSRFVGGPSADATPTPMMGTEYVVAEVDYADEGATYHFQIVEEGYQFVMDYLAVRDGKTLHIWFGMEFSFDSGALAQPLELIAPLLEEWFKDGSRAGEDLLTWIPDPTDLPDGYTLDDELVGTDAIGEVLMSDE